MPKEEKSKILLARNIILILNIILALLIISTSFKLSQTQLGKMALIFGFIMLAITTILFVLRKIN